MGGTHRKNKCKRGRYGRDADLSDTQPWFPKSVQRRRKRNQQAKESRRVNRS